MKAITLRICCKSYLISEFVPNNCENLPLMFCLKPAPDFIVYSPHSPTHTFSLTPFKLTALLFTFGFPTNGNILKFYLRFNILEL